MAIKKGRKRAPKKINVRIGKKRRHRAHHKVSGSAHRRTRRKKKGFLGTTHGGSLGQIAWMAVGVGVGAGITHVILRPVEAKLVNKWPMIGKFIAAGEVFLGGIIALKSKHDFVKSVGVGILAGGVHGLMKQANIYKHIPTVAGANEYSEIHVPISGPLDDMIAGILEDSRRDVHTESVAGFNYTNSVANSGYMRPEYTQQVAGDFEDAADFYVKS